MKKALSLILVFSLVFSLFATPFSAAELSEEKTVTSISPAEDIVLTENYDGYYSESDGVFYYNFYNRYGNFEDNFEFTVTYSDNTSENITISESKRREPENCIECNYVESQREQPWALGSSNYMLIHYKNANALVQVTIEKNPVESISVVSGDAYVYENIDGHISNYLDSDGNEFFYYDVYTALKGVVLGINYSDGSYGEIDLSEYSGKNISVKTDQEDNHWTKDKVNYMTVSFYGRETAVPVTVIESPVEKIELVSGSITLYENADGYFQNDTSGNSYFYYTLPETGRNKLQFKITYKDGTTETGRIFNTIRDRQIQADYSVIQQTEHWAAGKENSFTVSYIGATVRVPVEIAETPVESLELVSDGYTLYENTNGYTVGDDFRYNLYNCDEDKIQIKINYKNGTSKIAGLNETVDGRTIRVTDDQDENPWTVGNTYYVTASVYGASVKIPVRIVENNIASIDLIEGSIFLTENVGGYMKTDELGKQYYYYGPAIFGINNFLFRINYTDGTYTDIRYGDSNRFAYVDSQLENHWAVDGRNFLTVTYLGKSTDITVTVNESSVSRIYTFFDEPIELTENTNGYYENGSFIYNLPYEKLDNVYFMIDYKAGYFNQVKFSDIRSDITYTSDQYTNPWKVNETHNFTISYFGATCDIPVIIKSTNVESFELISEPLSCYGVNADIFDILMNSEFRIHFKDGSTQDISYFEDYDGNRIEYVDDRYDNPWVVGENRLTLKFAGVSLTVPVTVYENPIERMEIVSDPLVFIEGYDGEFVTGTNSQTGQPERFFVYDVSARRNEIKIKLYYKDGTEEIVSAAEPPIENTIFSVIHYQYSEHYKLGTDNYCEIKYLDLPAVRVPVTVIESPVEKIELASEGLTFTENNGGYFTTDNSGNEFYFYSIYSYNLEDLSFKVTYKDGTSEVLPFTSDSGKYSFTFDVSGQREKPWRKGENNFFTVSYLGATTEVPVTIEEFPIASVELVSDGITIIENTDGWSDITGTFYYNYQSYISDLKFKITYKDGHSITVGGTQSFGDYYISTSDNQHEDPWLRGKENYLTASVGSVSTKVPVTIIESPVASLELVSGTATLHSLSRYFPYIESQISDLVFRVKYKDGTQKLGVFGSGLDGQPFEVTGIHDYWEYIEVSYLGASVRIPLVITTDTIVGLEYVSGKIEFYEKCGGYEMSENRYVYEKWANCDVILRITYGDESTELVKLTDIKDLFVSFDDQLFVPWEKGGSYRAYASFDGSDRGTPIPVEITENAIDRIEITKAPTFVYTFGDTKYGRAFDGSYYLYDFNLEGLEFTVHYKDGSSKTYTYNDLVDGNIGELPFDIHTYNDDVSVGENTVVIEFMGMTAEYEITVTESEVESISVIKDPDNTSYIETPDLTGAVIRITYTNGTFVDKTVAASDIVFDGNSFGIKFGDEIIAIDSYAMEDWKLFYNGAVCDLDTVTMISLEDAKSFELVKPSETGKGMSIKITYADGTEDTISFISVAEIESDNGQFYGIARTSLGFMNYSINSVKTDDCGNFYNFTSMHISISAHEEKSPVLLGDVNGDGRVNGQDRLLLTRWLAKWADALAEGIDEDAADIDGDGKVTGHDRLLLTRYLAHWPGYELN